MLFFPENSSSNLISVQLLTGDIDYNDANMNTKWEGQSTDLKQLIDISSWHSNSTRNNFVNGFVIPREN